MSSNKDARRAKKKKAREQKNKDKVLKIRSALRKKAKDEKSRQWLSREIQKSQNPGITIRGKVSG
jgi:2-phosphoglycerate kinase